MEPWIILSIAAAAFQTLRFMLQKHLSMGALSAGGATLGLGHGFLRQFIALIFHRRRIDHGRQE